MRHFPLLLVLLLSFASCSKESSTQLPSDPEQRWNSFHVHDYTIDQTASCFCPTGGQPMRLTVRADTVYAVVRISDDSVLPTAQWPMYHSVEGLFDLIRNNSGDSLVVQYNNQYGYPEYLDVNPQLHAVDAGIAYQTTNLRPF